MAAACAFELTPEQELLRDEVRRFAEERITPEAARRDRDGEFPAGPVREMGEMGLLGMLVPERYGGAGLDPVSYVVAVEELARVCPATAVTMRVTNSVCWGVAPASRLYSGFVRRPGRAAPDPTRGGGNA